MFAFITSENQPIADTEEVKVPDREFQYRAELSILN